MMQRNVKASALAILVSLAAAATVGAVPTSVLADSKAANDVTTSSGLANQLTTDDATYGDGDRPGASNPQKRGVNPLLYREAELRNDFSGNSIPQNGVWEDVEEPALRGLPYPVPPGDSLFDVLEQPGPLDRAVVGGHDAPPRTYDVLQRLLSRPQGPLYNQPLLLGAGGPLSVVGSGGGGGGGGGAFPASLRLHGGRAYGGARKKRRTADGKSTHSQLMRLKRNAGKLSPAEVFSLLALMDSRDPYRPLADYAPDTRDDDLLASYSSPTGTLYPVDVPFPLALEQLLGGRAAAGGSMPADSGYAYEDAGEWMNSWTDPSVDYLGLPMADLDSLGSLTDGPKSFGPMNGYLPQKRFMVSKKKRSVPQAPAKAAPAVSGCKVGDAACGSLRQGTIQAAA